MIVKHPVIRWVKANLVVCVMGLLLFSFFISTIALAVRKNNLAGELEQCQADSGSPINPNSFQYRLSNQVTPIHYDLTLRPDLDTDSFEGNVKIQIHLTENVKEFALHKGKDMKINNAEIVGAKANTPLKISYNDILEYVILTVETGYLLKTAEKEYHTVSVDFSSEGMNTTNLGFYSSKYMDGGVEQKMVSSKFQPTYARRAFPCFDEPGYKATFTVTLVMPNDQYTALSNMKEHETINEGDVKKAVVFEQSVPMSTYLVVFMVSKLVPAHTAKLEGTDGVDFTVYTAQDQKDDGKYAFEVGKKLTEFYIEYFGVPYALGKLDMAGIPEYPTGATEHWGLITFRQSSFLYNPTTSSARNKKSVAAVISHELVHQWFGNLVTMHWWNDIWLNEGFASYIEYKGLQKAEPDWHIMDSFTVDDMHSVLVLDALPSTRAILKGAKSPDEITALFDSIAYNKAASIIRMMDDFVGNENFQKTVTKYLNDNMYKSTVTKDFLKTFEALKLEVNVEAVMDTWTAQPGYPLLTVTKVSDTKIKITQKRFAVNTQTKIEAKKYTIPIRYRTDDMPAGESKLVWMTKYQDSIEVDLVTAKKWVKVNDDQVGYYRVTYEDSMWTALIAALKAWPESGDHVFSTLNRAHLLNDVFALADGEYLSYDNVFGMLDYLPKERNLVPWTVAISQMKKIMALMDSDPLYPKLRTYFLGLSQEAYTDVKFSTCGEVEEKPITTTSLPTTTEEVTTTGTAMEEVTTTETTQNPTWDEPICSEDDDPHPIQMLREKLVDLLCYLDYEECLAQVKLHFNAYLTVNTPVSPNVRQSVYFYGLKTATDDAIWDTMFDRLLAETDPQEITKLMFALSAPESGPLVSKYIEQAWDKLKMQDFFSVLSYLSDNARGRTIVWDWVRENWPNLVDRYTLNERSLGRVIPNITKRFSTQTRLDELEAFFKKYPDAGAGAAAREEAKETIVTNIRWMSINRPIISDWLNRT